MNKEQGQISAVSSDENLEHRPIGWEKPAWATKHKLKATEKGAEVKQGADLQKPITHIHKLTKHKDGEEVNEQKENAGTAISAVETKPLGWQKPEWAVKTKLKPTVHGSIVKEGKDLQMPITKATAINVHDEVNNEVKVRDGEVSPAPVQQRKSSIGWQKPDWAKQQPKLRNTEKGNVLKVKGDLQAPITHVSKEDSVDYINFEANPVYLKSTAKGKEARFGAKLEKPITHIRKFIKPEEDEEDEEEMRKLVFGDDYDNLDIDSDEDDMEEDMESNVVSKEVDSMQDDSGNDPNDEDSEKVERSDSQEKEETTVTECDAEEKETIENNEENETIENNLNDTHRSADGENENEEAC